MIDSSSENYTEILIMNYMVSTLQLLYPLCIGCICLMGCIKAVPRLGKAYIAYIFIFNCLLAGRQGFSSSATQPFVQIRSGFHSASHSMNTKLNFSVDK
jgi:hypothetical protein